MQVSLQHYVLTWTRAVWCPSWLWYRRNLPYSLAEVSFLSLDSACRSPVAIVCCVRGLHVFGSTCSSVSLSGAELSEPIRPLYLVVVFHLFFGARRPVAYDRVFPVRFYLVLVLASFGKYITWHRFCVPWIVQVRGRSSCGRSRHSRG